MSKDPKLGGFKIGDVQRREVKSYQKTVDPDPSTEDVEDSVGFPAVEGRLEAGSADDVADELRGSYEKLEELSRTGDMKSKAAAKKAMAAYERTADLFEYLFATKDSLASPPAE